MTDAQPLTAKELSPVRKSVVVAASQERAFKVFTAGLATWWPLESHHISKVEPETVVIEPFVGGRCYERGIDGTECDWGRVAAFDPPDRLVLVWQLNAEWAHDTTIDSEVEVRFVAEGPDTTRVELEHRGFDSYGERAQEIHDSVGSEGGWSGLLSAFAVVASA